MFSEGLYSPQPPSLRSRLCMEVALPHMLGTEIIALGELILQNGPLTSRGPAVVSTSQLVLHTEALMLNLSQYQAPRCFPFFFLLLFYSPSMPSPMPYGKW